MKFKYPDLVTKGDTPCPMLKYSFAFLFPKKHCYMSFIPLPIYSNYFLQTFCEKYPYCILI